MKFIIYDILLHAALVVSAPYFLYRMLSAGKYKTGLRERFGFIDDEKLKGLEGSEVIWIHAVSVGEAKAVIPLLRLIKKRRPEAKLVFSTVTPTGNKVAAEAGGQWIDALIYFPMDFTWVVKRAVAAIRPDIFVVVEKEIWPNVFRILKQGSVPVVVVNGTLSEKSFKRYRRLSFLFGEVFTRLDAYLPRSPGDAEMALMLGVRDASLTEAGNLKFDIDAESSVEELQSLARELGISDSTRVIVAGSTHAGEETIILRAFKEVSNVIAGLTLIVAPRHPERFDEVAGLIEAEGLTCSKRSQGPLKDHAEVILLDTMGELGRVYGISTISFVGGTLVDIGGHNLLEPAVYSVPVIYGPHLKSYLYMAEMLESVGASRRVTNDDLAATVKELLTDDELRKEMGRAGAELISSNKGSTERAMNVISGLLDKRGGLTGKGAGE